MNSILKINRQKVKYIINRSFNILKTPPVTNIYHASVQKAGSQWLKQVFNDKEIVKHTKLTLYPQHRYEWDDFRKKFPKNTFVPGLYLSYQSYEEIKKPKNYKTIYVTRDPRELIISWYYSMKDSHGLMGKVFKHRRNLEKLNQNDGITYCIQHFQLKLSFMKDWIVNCEDPNVTFLRFEDLVRNPLDSFFDLFQEIGIPIEKNVLSEVLTHYTKDKMRERESSRMLEQSHYRDKPLKWKDLANEEHVKLFKALNGEIVELLGYKW